VGTITEQPLLSPAKVNLFLKVISKRPDGYHNLVSVVDIIDLYDVMRLKEAQGGEVVVRDDRGLLPHGAANTIYRAIMLIKEKYGIPAGVVVDVEKHIPIGSGLGGGSGNAATVMKELVRLWGLPAEHAELAMIGRQVGADVPLFLHGKSCVMRGVGERISPIDLPVIWYVLVYPNAVVNTRDVYNNLRIVLTRDENEVTFSGKFSHVRDVVDILENDLEEAAFLLCPQIKTIKERLKKAGALGSLMTGSGSAVFGVFEDETSARKVLEEVGGLGSVFIAHSV
jgi:4-diphosphocytidyl-2-C-methyl-D-erythritol kinase